MKPSILAKLDLLKDRFEELQALLSDAEIISDQNKFRTYSQEYSELEPVVQTFNHYQQVLDNIEEAKLMMDDGDAEMREMAQEEIETGKEELGTLELDLQKLLL
ncbi:MAG: peptide chain release factor 1, partial [Oceanospirillum sp.]|nr:peptide chain release factor 1 [Oceanospirillum sp.]